MGEGSWRWGELLFIEPLLFLFVLFVLLCSRLWTLRVSTKLMLLRFSDNHRSPEWNRCVYLSSHRHRQRRESFLIFSLFALWNIERHHSPIDPQVEYLDSTRFFIFFSYWVDMTSSDQNICGLWVLIYVTNWMQAFLWITHLCFVSHIVIATLFLWIICFRIELRFLCVKAEMRMCILVLLWDLPALIVNLAISSKNTEHGEFNIHAGV